MTIFGEDTAILKRLSKGHWISGAPCISIVVYAVISKSGSDVKGCVFENVKMAVVFSQ